MRMRKKWMTVICAMVLAGCLGLSGCAQEPAKPAPEELTCKAELYYVNEEAVVSGSGSYMMEDPIEVKLTGTSQELLMKAVVESLKGVPENNPGYATMLPETLEVNGVTAEKGVATVDLKIEGLSGSSLEESCLIAQIVESLCETFDDIDSVQFLVNGEKTDSLMGHYDISKPIGEDFFDDMFGDDTAD